MFGIVEVESILDPLSFCLAEILLMGRIHDADFQFDKS